MEREGSRGKRTKGKIKVLLSVSPSKLGVKGSQKDWRQVMPAQSLDKGDDDKQLFQLMACSHLAWGSALIKSSKLSKIWPWIGSWVRKPRWWEEGLVPEHHHGLAGCPDVGLLLPLSESPFKQGV